MPKNTHSRSGRSSWNAPMTFAMKLFLGGCFAELYLMLIRRFYIMGTLQQVVAWSAWLPRLGVIALLIGAAGLALLVSKKGSKNIRKGAVWALGLGAFVGAASFLVVWKMSLLTFLLVLVPVLMLLVVLWSLYDRECATALTILALSLTALWAIRRAAVSMYLGRYVKIAAVVYLLVLIAYALYIRKVNAARTGTKPTGKWQLWSTSADPLPVYIACGLSVAAVVVSLLSATAAYYATWGLAAIVFALAVYYTVKQL